MCCRHKHVAAMASLGAFIVLIYYTAFIVLNNEREMYNRRFTSTWNSPQREGGVTPPQRWKHARGPSIPGWRHALRIISITDCVPSERHRAHNWKRNGSIWNRNLKSLVEIYLKSNQIANLLAVSTADIIFLPKKYEIITGLGNKLGWGISNKPEIP